MYSDMDVKLLSKYALIANPLAAKGVTPVKSHYGKAFAVQAR